MAVAIRAHLEQPPASAQEACQLAAEDNAALGIAAFGQLQVPLDVVLEKFADIARVVEVTFSEFLSLIAAKIFAQ